MKVVAIYRHNRDSWVGGPGVLVGIAADDGVSPKQLIQDEVDGKRGSGHQYASGHDAEWWLDQGWFTTEIVDVFKI